MDLGELENPRIWCWKRLGRGRLNGMGWISSVLFPDGLVLLVFRFGLKRD